MNITFIGGGVMGEAIVSAALEGGVFTPGEVTVCEIIATRREVLAARYGVAVTDDIQSSTFRHDTDQLRRYRDYAGDGVFRLSIGIEGGDDLISDLARTPLGHQVS